MSPLLQPAKHSSSFPCRYLSADYERKVFNVSECVWNQGAEENIVTITSRDSDSDSGNGDGSSSSGSSGLSGGAIAGIVVACVVAVALIAAVIVLRKRRKWMGAGFAVSAKDPPPDESVLKGPVFNSPSTRLGSTPDSSVPFSAADVSGSGSGSRSTAEYARPASSTAGGSVTNSSTPELDGRDTAIKPDIVRDGNEIRGPLPPVAESPGGLYELPGSNVVAEGSHGGKAEMDRAPSPVGSSAHGSARGGWNHSPPSPVTSTLDRNPVFGRDSMVSNQ